MSDTTKGHGLTDLANVIQFPFWAGYHTAPNTYHTEPINITLHQLISHWTN